MSAGKKNRPVFGKEYIVRLKALILSLVFAVLPLMAVHAEATGSWTEVGFEFNNGNGYWCIGAANDQVMVAFGSMGDGQGGTSPVTRRSINGGVSWSPVTLPTFGGFYTIISDIQMINENLGYAAGGELGMTGTLVGPMYKITNKGANWEVLPSPIDSICMGSKIFCLPDGLNCWVTCDSGYIIHTYDGGTNFNVYTVPNTELNAGPIHFINENEGWAAFYKTETIDNGDGTSHTNLLDEGTIYHTTNGGSTWETLVEEELLEYTDIQFIDSNVGYLTADDGGYAYVLKTTDGGHNWDDTGIMKDLPVGSDPSKYPKLFYLAGIEFFDANRGWAVGSYGEPEGSIMNTPALYYTENGGDSWAIFPTSLQDGSAGHGGTFTDVDFLDEHMGFAVADMMLLVKYDDGQYIPPDPPVDGDSDGDWDGEGEAPGPEYTGALGEPCPVPGMNRSDTHDYPRCDAGQGSEFCVFNSDISYCSQTCQADANCPGEWKKVCCRPLTINGESQNVCVFDEEMCADSELLAGEWYSYNGQVVGETCDPEDKPPCDEHFGGDFCVATSSPFCSQMCDDDSDCQGGFTAGCCNGKSGSTVFCQFGAVCNPEPEDGDEDSVTDGDYEESIPDGDDYVVDGDVMADGDQGNAAEGSGGSCNGSASLPSIFVMLSAAAAIVFNRRRK